MKKTRHHQRNSLTLYLRYKAYTFIGSAICLADDAINDSATVLYGDVSFPEDKDIHILYGEHFVDDVVDY